MNAMYTQKNDTVQKVANTNAESVNDSSAQNDSLQRKADMAKGTAQRAADPRPNNTGLPDDLKTGIESLSGFSMDDVRVHYNSSRPASVQALAYTQGTDIHVAPGQEQHLPHEAWHVAQQMAGRVAPTTNINGMPVNDNAGLEHEADVMGERALQRKGEDSSSALKRVDLNGGNVQRMNVVRQSTRKFRDNHILCSDGLSYGGEYSPCTPEEVLLDRYEYENVELNSMMTFGDFQSMSDAKPNESRTVRAKTWTIRIGEGNKVYAIDRGEGNVRVKFNDYGHAAHMDEKIGKK